MHFLFKQLYSTKNILQLTIFMEKLVPLRKKIDVDFLVEKINTEWLKNPSPFNCVSQKRCHSVLDC